MPRRVALALAPVSPLVVPRSWPARDGMQIGVIGLAGSLFEFSVCRVVVRSSRPEREHSSGGATWHVQGSVTHRIQLDDVTMPLAAADSLQGDPVQLWLPGGFSVTHVPAAILTYRNETWRQDDTVRYFQQIDLLALTLETVDGYPSRQQPHPALVIPGRSHLAPNRPRPVVVGPRPFNPGRRRVIVCSATALPSPGDRGLDDSGCGHAGAAADY